MKQLVVLLTFLAFPLVTSTTLAASRPPSAGRSDRMDALYKGYGKATLAHKTGTIPSGPLAEVAPNGTRTTTTISIKDDKRGRTVNATVLLQRPGGRPQVGKVRIRSKAGEPGTGVRLTSHPALPWKKP